MGRKMNLRDFMGIVKDTASQSKAALLLSKPHSLCNNFHLPLLRATTHDPLTPPKPKHLDLLLSRGHSSRATASVVVEAIMDRLHSTHNASVAIKCLITVHYISRHGSFILQDQLSVYPATGGRNYLNLSKFRDNTTPFSWELSSWIRWYACYLEHLLSTCRALGYFLCSASSTLEKEKEEENVSAFLNRDLLKELDHLVDLVQETCRIPDSLHLKDNKLIGLVAGFVSEDYLSAVEAISIRVNEFGKRLCYLSFGESVELVCCLKRLEKCKERLSASYSQKMGVLEGFWCLIREVKERVEERKESSGLGKVGASESARFGGQVLRSDGESVIKFSSGRFLGLSRHSYSSAESG